MAEPPVHRNPNRPTNGRTASLSNRILASLPKSSRELFHAVEQVSLQTGMVLYEPDEKIDHVYFLHDALVSVMCLGSDGSTVEIGLIGSEGMVGIPAILGGGDVALERRHDDHIVSSAVLFVMSFTRTGLSGICCSVT